MGFRSPQVITRTTTGGYSAATGLFVDGVSSSVTISASVQPMSGEDMKTLPSGKRVQDYIKVYTSTDLQVTNEAAGLVADRLAWRGHVYECISVDVRQMNVINHYKYIFSKINQT